MKFKRLATALFLILTILSLPVSSVAAADNIDSSYIWDESRAQAVTAYNLSNIPLTINSDPINSSTISPMLLYMYTFDHYSENSETLNWKQKYVGVTRVDNSGSVSPTTLTFIASTTNSWSISGTTGSEVTIELNAIKAKVAATSQFSATGSRSWETGFSYGVSTTVPPHMIGKVTAYIPGTSSSGYAVYKVTNTSNNTYWYENRARGAIVPAQNAWNIVSQIPCP